MKKSLKLLSVILILGSILISCNQDKTKDTENELKNLKQGPYLGQKPPGDVPELFAPGVVSSVYIEHSSAVFTPDGNDK